MLDGNGTNLGSMNAGEDIFTAMRVLVEIKFK
jgi:hypothetical protein